MFKLLTKIPENFYVAVSSGIDSMVALNFLSNHKGFRGIVHCHHGTKHADDALKFLYAEHGNEEITVFRLSEGKPENQSQEEYWSNWRRECFNSMHHPVVTSHHLGDSSEWALMSALHGEMKLMPIESGNVLRPFLATSKAQIEEWAERKMVKYIDDPSNQSRKYARNIVRHDLMPVAKLINPGFETVIRKKYLNV